MNTKLMEIFKDHIHFPEDCTDLCWTESNDEISYNKENDVSDLMDGNGETYSGSVKSSIELEGYIMYELDSGCGWDYQAIFSRALKVDEVKYWEEQED